MDDIVKTKKNDNVTNIFANYFIYLKDNNCSIGYTDVYMGVFTALAGLDAKYNTPEFVQDTARGFKTIAEHLDKIAHEMYVETKNKEGVYDRYSNSNNCCYTVLEIADKLGITRQAVNAAINKGLLKAHTQNGQHMVYAEDFLTYKSQRKRK